MQSTWRVERTPARIRRTPGDFAALFAGLSVLALVGLLFGWQLWHTNRIYTGVTVAGVPVGGLSRSEALDRLTQNLTRYPLPTLSVAYGGRQWPITGDHARVSTDLLAAVNRAYLVGRQGGLGSRLADQVAAGLGVVDVSPDVQIDAAQLRYTVDQIASEVRTPARAPAQMGEVMVPGQPGLDVDVEATVQALSAALEDSAPGDQLTTLSPRISSMFSWPKNSSTRWPQR